MKEYIRKLGEKASSEILKIVHFHALTAFTYHFTEEKVSAGERLTLILGDPRFKEETITGEELLPELRDYKTTYLIDLAFQHCVSIFEWYFFDLLEVLLKFRPEHISGKRQFELSIVFNSEDKPEIIKKVVDIELNKLKYQNIFDWMEYLNKIVGIEYPSGDDIEKLAEMKASRDVIVHNNYIVNDVYLRKAGKFTRFKLGDKLKVNEKEYFNDCAAFIKGIIENISDKVVNKYNFAI